MRQAEEDAVLELPNDRIDDVGMLIPERYGAQRIDPIYIPVPVNILYAGTISSLDGDRK
jgi:hypothetical protein